MRYPALVTDSELMDYANRLFVIRYKGAVIVCISLWQAAARVEKLLENGIHITGLYALASVEIKVPIAQLLRIKNKIA